MSTTWRTYSLLFIMLALLVVIAVAMQLSGVLSFASGVAPFASTLDEAASGPVVAGQYDGSVTLNGVFTGVYSDTAATPTAMDLGYIDLALLIDQTGTSISAYVDLSRTVVFSQIYTITVTPVAPAPGTGTPVSYPLAVGPHLVGNFDGSVLRLESEPFSLLLSESRVLPLDNRTLPEQRVTRQFSLRTTEIRDNGATLVGEYRETIWGYAADPTTVVGTFTLQRPVFTPLATPDANSDKVYLPVISR